MITFIQKKNNTLHSYLIRGFVTKVRLNIASDASTKYNCTTDSLQMLKITSFASTK